MSTHTCIFIRRFHSFQPAVIGDRGDTEIFGFTPDDPEGMNRKRMIIEHVIVRGPIVYGEATAKSVIVVRKCGLSREMELSLDPREDSPIPYKALLGSITRLVNNALASIILERYPVPERVPVEEKFGFRYETHKDVKGRDIVTMIIPKGVTVDFSRANLGYTLGFRDDIYPSGQYISSVKPFSIDMDMFIVLSNDIGARILSDRVSPISFDISPDMMTRFAAHGYRFALKSKLASRESDILIGPGGYLEVAFTIVD